MHTQPSLGSTDDPHVQASQPAWGPDPQDTDMERGTMCVPLSSDGNCGQVSSALPALAILSY